MLKPPFPDKGATTGSAYSLLDFNVEKIAHDFIDVFVIDFRQKRVALLIVARQVA